MSKPYGLKEYKDQPALCRCQTDDKCPHAISAKLPSDVLDSIEKAIDEKLIEFDRKEINKFLKRNVEGEVKPNLTMEGMIHDKTYGFKIQLPQYYSPEYEAEQKKKMKAANTLRPLTSPLPANANKTSNNQFADGSAPHAWGAEDSNDPQLRAATAGGPSLIQNKNRAFAQKDALSQSLPRLPDRIHGVEPRPISPTPPTSDFQQERAFTAGTLKVGNLRVRGPNRDPFASSYADPTGLPLDKQAAAKKRTLNSILDSRRDFVEAWGTSTATTLGKLAAEHKSNPGGVQPPGSRPGTSGGVGGDKAKGTKKNKFDLPTVSKAPVDVPEESHLSISLMRLADVISRRVLPWQAALCPRAIEGLYDLRLSIVQARHNDFMEKMTKKLQEKVLGFTKKKSKEVGEWMDKDVQIWRNTLAATDEDLPAFLKVDMERMVERAAMQEQRYYTREALMATELDEHERSGTRQQLQQFRQIVRKADNALLSQKAAAEYQLNALQSSLDKAKLLLSNRAEESHRDVIRKREESHDWLCSLADNAITAQECESLLNMLYQRLDAAKSNGLDELDQAMRNYIEQHDTISAAVETFVERMLQHANDYISREQLVAKAFCRFLLKVVSDDQQVRKSDVYRETYAHRDKLDDNAWQTKLTSDRCHRKEQAMLGEFSENLRRINELVHKLRVKLASQREELLGQLSGVGEGRDKDVDVRKERIHKKLAKHCNSACLSRRKRLKASTVVRREEFTTEARCIASVAALTKDLRSSIDQAWTREQQIERRMQEAAAGRLDRLERSALLMFKRQAQTIRGEREEYSAWHTVHRSERDALFLMKRTELDASFHSWRGSTFQAQLLALVSTMRMPVKKMFTTCYRYKVEDSYEQNKEELLSSVQMLMEDQTERILALRATGDAFSKQFLGEVDSWVEQRETALLEEWRENLTLLNTIINRRIAGLKGMERDLEDTIRANIELHESECSLFEQRSCAGLEQFWLDWRRKMFIMSRRLKDSQAGLARFDDIAADPHNDMPLVKIMDELEPLPPAAAESDDEEEDDDDMGLVGIPNKATAGAAEQLNTDKEQKRQEEEYNVADESPFDEDGNVVERKLAGSEAPERHPEDVVGSSSFSSLRRAAVSDTFRIRRILDEVREEAFLAFAQQFKAFLLALKKAGEGRRRLVPAFAVSKAFLVCADEFFGDAKLSERCVGRVSSNGMYLFQDGLPEHARSTFCLAALMAMLSKLTLHGENGRLDVAEVLDVSCRHESSGNLKELFTAGLLTLTLHLGSFGQHMSNSEILWACSACGLQPPFELTPTPDPNQGFLTGFYSQDPTALVNTVVANPTVTPADVQEVLTSGANLDKDDDDSEDDTEDDGTMGTNLTGDNHSFAYVKNPAGSLFAGIVKTTGVTTAEFLKSHRGVLPAADLLVIVAMLGKPGDSVELTTHQLCQTVFVWRQTGVALLTMACDPTSTYFPRIHELVDRHNAKWRAAGNGGASSSGRCNIEYASQLEAVSRDMDWLTSVPCLPVSVLQALCLLSRGGSCDPWLEDPKLSGRALRLEQEVTELLDAYQFKMSEKMTTDSPVKISLPKNLAALLKAIDVNDTQEAPVEALRAFVQKVDGELTNTQVTMIFWALARSDNISRGVAKGEDIAKLPQLDATDGVSEPFPPSTMSVATGDGSVKAPIVATVWDNDPDEYMEAFAVDVKRYLESTGFGSVGQVMGFLPSKVAKATLSDAAARNALPSRCCLWVAKRIMALQDIFAAIVSRDLTSEGGDLLLGVGPNSFNSRGKSNAWLANIRPGVEVDILAKYPELCERCDAVVVEDMVKITMQVKGAPKSVREARGGDDDHWKMLTDRRLQRADKLTLSWRNCMLSEWAQSLHDSKYRRAEHRVRVIKKCLEVYHKQYEALGKSIVVERRVLMSEELPVIQKELRALFKEMRTMANFHLSYVVRSLQRYEQQFMQLVVVSKDMLCEFQRHVGAVRRKGLGMVQQANDKLRSSLEFSCNSMITSYSIDSAKAFFDTLVGEGESWKVQVAGLQTRTEALQGRFFEIKGEAELNVTTQLDNRLNLHRSQAEGQLQALQVVTAKMLDVVASTRADYAGRQKDGNARLILRIEKAVRECRRLRVAAEQNPELADSVLADVSKVLATAKQSCMETVAQIQASCAKELEQLKPGRPAHLDFLKTQITKYVNGWETARGDMTPVVADFETGLYKELMVLRAKVMEMIEIFLDDETKRATDMHRSERVGLVGGFRDHFREYDLQEEAIFRRFNEAVNGLVDETTVDYFAQGRPPQFVELSLKEMRNVVTDSLEQAHADVSKTYKVVPWMDDDRHADRYALADLLTFSLQKSCDVAEGITQQFLAERHAQLQEVEAVSMACCGDMVRPQVVAVMDMLLAGIEIDTEFRKGYDTLVNATTNTAAMANATLDAFTADHTNPEVAASIQFAAAGFHGKISGREAEVEDVIEACNAQLASDESQFDVLMGAADKDIADWTQLTTQLLESAIASAEATYLAPFTAELSPPGTPRKLATTAQVAVDKDKMDKLTVLIGMNQAESDAMMGVLLLAQEDEEMEARKRDRKAMRQVEREKREKRMEEESRRNAPPSVQEDTPQVVSKLVPDETRELQRGWFECCSPDGYIYYHNPASGESLWELPAELKDPIHTADEESLRHVEETPREMLESLQLVDPTLSTLPADDDIEYLRVLPEGYESPRADPKVVMTAVASEASELCAAAIEMALDISAVIHGARHPAGSGAGEVDLFALLGDKYNPEFWLEQERKEKERARMLAGLEEEEATVVSMDSIDRRLLQSNLGVEGDGSDAGTEGLFGKLSQGQSIYESHISLPAIDEDFHPEHSQASDLRNLGLGSPGASFTESYTAASADFTFVVDPAEEKAREEAERRDMDEAEKASTQFENDVEDFHCKGFLTKLMAVLQEHYATEEDVAYLEQVSLVIRPANLENIFSGLGVDWDKIDTIVRESQAEDARLAADAQAMAEFDAARRQQLLQEHREDVDDLALWLNETGGLSKGTAKRVAAEAVLHPNSLNTARKLARVWGRGEVDLVGHFEIDNDDAQELAGNLQALLDAIAAEPEVPLHLPPLLEQPSVAPYSLSPAAGESVWSTGVPGLLSADKVMAGLPQTHSFNLGPSVSVVEDDPAGYDDDSRPASADAVAVAGAAAAAAAAVGAGGLSRKTSSRRFKLTEEGYKSFKGGWIEGLSEDSQVYFYNTVSGQSSWHLPVISDAPPDEAEEAEFPHEEDTPEHELEMAAALAAGGAGGVGGAVAGEFPAAVGEPGGGHYGAFGEWIPFDEATNGWVWDEHGQEWYWPWATEDSPVGQEGVEGSIGAAPSLQGGQSLAQGSLEQDSVGQESVEQDSAFSPEQETYMQDEMEQDPAGAMLGDAVGEGFGAEPSVSDESLEAAMALMNGLLQQGAAQTLELPSGEGVDGGGSTSTPPTAERDKMKLFAAKKLKSNLHELRVQPKPRTLPVAVHRSVKTYLGQVSQLLEEGVTGKLRSSYDAASASSDRYVDEQQALFHRRRDEMFGKVSTRVEGKLEVFVNDIKFMQKAVKQALTECISSETDLRRQFEEDLGAVAAEKLSGILESLETLKVVSNDRYESAFLQLDTFADSWTALKTELLAVGRVYDEAIEANLQQCQVIASHNVKVFCSEQLDAASAAKKKALSDMRWAFRAAVRRGDSLAEQRERDALRQQQHEYHHIRESQRLELFKSYGGWYSGAEEELCEVFDLPPLDPADESLPEEELVMSFMLSQVELEATQGVALFDRHSHAVREAALTLQARVDAFAAAEHGALATDGSWFSRHEEALERHEAALQTTLSKVRQKVNEGYALLNSRLEALDADVERAAEEELAAVDASAEYDDTSTLFHGVYGEDDERNSLVTGK